MKKAVLIAPPNDFAGNVNVLQFTSLLAPPMSILALGAYLTAHDVPVELIDVQIDFGFGLTHAAERAVARRVARYLAEQADQIAWVGLSQLSNAGSGVVIAEEVHAARPDLPILFGGYFPSSAYRSLLERYPFITAVVRGDGEAAALAISRAIAAGQPFLSDETPGLAWWDGNEIRESSIRPMGLADLPILDFRLLRSPRSYQIVDLMTSRGCPFHCSYCLEGTMRPYAAHPPSWVDRQLTHLESQMPNERVFIYDPVFGLGRRRALEMCRVLEQHRFTYAVESRVDVLEPSLLPTLRAAGVETVFLGIESASPATLRRMNKLPAKRRPEQYLAQAMDVLEACFRADVTPVMGFMLGFPGDTEADYQATLAFVQAIAHLHDRVVAQTGVETGFVPFAFYTKIYEGSPLAGRVAEDFPRALLRSEPFIGERTVLSPSAGLDLPVTQRYQAEIARHGGYTTLALERLWHYYSFSLDAFLGEHPELQDEQGIVVLGDALQRFPQSFRVAATRMRYDKAKD